jgi:hypothetical protein
VFNETQSERSSKSYKKDKLEPKCKQYPSLITGKTHNTITHLKKKENKLQKKILLIHEKL